MGKLKSKPVAEDDAPALGRGDKSRAAILLATAQLATIRGLDGLSIGELAAHLGMSKSGLYAHFKSKQELELATIDTAVEIFDREVLRPAMAAPSGTKRLVALAEHYLSHLKRRVFPGGCFFAAVGAEMAMRPSPVRDRVVQVFHNWLELQEQCVRDAQKQSEINPAADVAQIVFEFEAMLAAANSLFVITGDAQRLVQARRGVENLLRRLSPRSPSKRNSAR